MALTYVCSPLSAPTQAEIMVNAQRARTYMTMCEREFGCRAVAPHAYLPYLLDDSNPEERALALSFGASLLALCDRLVIYGDRISSGMKEEIRRARELGIPILNRQTQLSDGSSDPVIVGRYINGISLNGLEYLKNDADEVIFFAGVEAAKVYLREHGVTEDEMEDMQKSGVTLSLLWVEYCERCRQNGELPYKSTQFNKYYADYVHKTKATMHLEHKPGENLQVDWAGQTAGITDTDTGERLPAYLFVAVLPYSGYAYTEAFLDMKQEAWITAHVHAYNYFGGVTRILTPDNLKTGVIKNTRTETVLNKAYQEMVEHYGTAIIPTRPRTPKDKAFVEGSVGVVSTWILAALRNRQFLSLDELNRAIWEKLADFNHKPFQKKDGSRASDFEEEKLFPLPLPPNPFELAEWKTATVQYNYHISVDRMNYSDPYEYIKQKVDVRLTGSAVEIYFCGTRVASHLRLYGRPNQYSMLEEHMPPEHTAYLQWNSKRFLRWASSIGENTAAVVRVFLTAHKVEQQGYKSCMALLKLSDHYSVVRLEDACRKALTFTPSHSLKSVQAILKSEQDLLQTEDVDPEPVPQKAHRFTRGAEYYRRGKK